MLNHFARSLISSKCHNDVVRYFYNEAVRNQVPFKDRLIYRFLKYFEARTNISSINWESRNSWKLRQLDQSLSIEASRLNNSELLQKITTYILSTENRIVNTQFYAVSKQLLAQRLAELSTQQLVHFMYVTALRKTEKEAQNIVRRCLNLLGNQDIKQLALIEKLAICDASFKTSSLITCQETLKYLSGMLYNHLDLLNDPGMFITLVKMLRLNMCQTEELLATISATIFFNSTHKLYDFIMICHILALYVDFFYYDKDLFDLFVNTALEQLSDHRVRIRNKDIHRFLWICSTMGLDLQEDQLKMIEATLLRRQDLFKHDPGLLVDCTFYLWTLNYQALCLLPFCKANMENIRTIGASEKTAKTKRAQRLDALLVCMEIENIELYKALKCRPQVFKFDCRVQLTQRPTLNKIFTILLEIEKELQLKRPKIAYQVPHINIAGVCGYYQNKKLSIEVFDETTRLKNVDWAMPTGMMRLKQRLLKTMGHTIIEINHDDVCMLEHKELKDYMRNKLTRRN